MKQPFSSVYAQVVDLKLFSPGRELPRGLLWVVEQAPGAQLWQPLMLGWDELTGAPRCLWAPQFSSACGWLMCSCAPTPFPPSHLVHPPSTARSPHAPKLASQAWWWRQTRPTPSRAATGPASMCVLLRLAILLLGACRGAAPARHAMLCYALCAVVPCLVVCALAVLHVAWTRSLCLATIHCCRYRTTGKCTTLLDTQPSLHSRRSAARCMPQQQVRLGLPPSDAR